MKLCWRGHIYRGVVPSHLSSYPDVPATFPDYYVDVSSNVYCNFEDLYTEDELLHLTVIKKTLGR